MFEPTHQYRCTIIRGKSQSEMEDLLPFYAQVVHKFCPCTEEQFNEWCNDKLSNYFFNIKSYYSLPENNKKTIRNHITEIMSKLLGLYYTDNEGYVQESSNCVHLNEHNDFPTFFKSICFNLHFPNGATKIKGTKEHIDNSINFRPLCYVISLLKYARENGNVHLTKQEVGYYVLNNLDVLQGSIPIKEVFDRILSDRMNGVRRERLVGSHDWQHIKEMFNLLNLANLCLTDNDYIWLNKEEEKAVEIFSKNTKPAFNTYAYNLNDRKQAEQFKLDWQEYYSSIDKSIAELRTSFATAASQTPVTEPIRQRGAVGLSTVELGDQGEALIYKMEIERISKYKARWVNKVLLLGKTKGLGYDISSLEADENPNAPEFARYIEVKSTKRVTKPSFDNKWADTLNLTAKEWTAAHQFGESYNIYRVYFTREETIVVRIKNPYKLNEDGVIDVFPTIYQMDFDKTAIANQYKVGSI